MPNVKFTVPSPYSQQAAELDRRQKMAELMQQQAMEPIQTQSAGGIVLPVSPVAGLSKLLRSYMSSRQLSDVASKRAALEQQDITAARQMAEEFGRRSTEQPIAERQASILPAALGAGVGPYQQKLAELLYTQKPEAPKGSFAPINMKDVDIAKSNIPKYRETGDPAYLVMNSNGSEPPETVGGMMWNSETKRYEPIQGFIPASGSDSGPRASQGPVFAFPDGRVTASVFENGRYYYDTSTGRKPVPPDARPTTAGVAAPLSQSQFIKYRQEINKDKQSLSLLNNYFATVKDMNVGYKRLADQVTANAKNLFGNELKVKELATQLAKGEKELLVGLFRTEVAGPGVVTADDYQRIMSALGGDPAKLQNPQVTESLLRNLYDTKKANVEFLERELSRSNQYYGVPASPPVPEFGGTQPSESSTPSRGFGKAVRE